jgi:hypothetical protein
VYILGSVGCWISAANVAAWVEICSVSRWQFRCDLASLIYPDVDVLRAQNLLWTELLSLGDNIVINNIVDDSNILKHEAHLNIIGFQPIPQRKQHVWLTTINWLTLLKEVSCYYFENHTKPVDIFCWQNAGLLIIKWYLQLPLVKELMYVRRYNSFCCVSSSTHRIGNCLYFTLFFLEFLRSLICGSCELMATVGT